MSKAQAVAISNLNAVYTLFVKGISVCLLDAVTCVNCLQLQMLYTMYFDHPHV